MSNRGWLRNTLHFAGKRSAHGHSRSRATVVEPGTDRSEGSAPGTISVLNSLQSAPEAKRGVRFLGSAQKFVKTPDSLMKID
jgi:hypothetical protein